jgi:hypothetical protein
MRMHTVYMPISCIQIRTCTHVCTYVHTYVYACFDSFFSSHLAEVAFHMTRKRRLFLLAVVELSQINNLCLGLCSYK